MGELNEKIKRKAHVKQSFSLDFLERGTFTEYPYLAVGGLPVINRDHSNSYGVRVLGFSDFPLFEFDSYFCKFVAVNPVRSLLDQADCFLISRLAKALFYFDVEGTPFFINKES